MNRSWLLLIVLGVIFLVAAVGWEIYQTTSGNRSQIDTTVLEYQRNKLFTQPVENFLNSDPNFTTSTNKQGSGFTSNLPQQNATSNQQQLNTTNGAQNNTGTNILNQP